MWVASVDLHDLIEQRSEDGVNKFHFISIVRVKKGWALSDSLRIGRIGFIVNTKN